MPGSAASSSPTSSKNTSPSIGMMGSKLVVSSNRPKKSILVAVVAGGSCTQTCATSLDAEHTGLLEPIAREAGVTTWASATPHPSMTAARVHAAANGNIPVDATVADAGPRRGGRTIRGERYPNESAAVKAHPARQSTSSHGADCVTSRWRGDADGPTRERGHDAGRKDDAGGLHRAGNAAGPRRRRDRPCTDRHRARQRAVQQPDGSRSQLHRPGPHLPDRPEC